MQSWIHLHDAVPVVSGGHSEQQQERHPKVFERSVATQTLTWVELVANCGEMEERQRGGNEEEREARQYKTEIKAERLFSGVTT